MTQSQNLFDIDALSKCSDQELQVLNKQIVDLLNQRRKLRTQEALRSFLPGDKVSFDYEGDIHFGTVVKLNRKTAGILTEEGEHWNVSPGILRRVESAV